MPQQKLTKTRVDAALPGEKDYILWDTDLTGFGLKVTPKGAKTYIFQYRMAGGRAMSVQRITIGPSGSAMTPDNARKIAETHAISAKRGINPKAAMVEAQYAAVNLRFDKYVEFFIEKYLPENWPGFLKEATRLLRSKAVPHFGRKSLPDLTKREITQFFDGLQARGETPRNLSDVMRKMFRWAVKRGDLVISPMDNLDLPQGYEARARFLTDEEIVLVWRASLKLDHAYGAMVRMLILSGQRRGEVAGMLRSEIDGAAVLWTIPAERTKQGKVQTVPLTDAMLEVIDSAPDFEGDYVFTARGNQPISNWSKWKDKLDAQVALIIAQEGAIQEVLPWRLHDLRRSVATGLQRLNVPREVIEAVQGRIVNFGAGTRYQRHDYEREKRDALDLWSSHVLRLVAVGSTNSRTYSSSRRASSNLEV